MSLPPGNPFHSHLKSQQLLSVSPWEVSTTRCELCTLKTIVKSSYQNVTLLLGRSQLVDCGECFKVWQQCREVAIKRGMVAIKRRMGYKSAKGFLAICQPATNPALSVNCCPMATLYRLGIFCPIIATSDLICVPHCPSTGNRAPELPLLRSVWPDS